MATRTERTLREILDALAADPQEGDVAATSAFVGAIGTALALQVTRGPERPALQDALSTFSGLIDVDSMDATTATRVVAAAAAAMEAGRAVAQRASESDALHLTIGLMAVGIASQGALFIADALIAAEPDETRRIRLEEALRAAFAPIRQAGHATAPPLQDLARRAFGRVMPQPDAGQMRAHMATGVTRMLAQLGSPEAREALELLARSGDAHLAEQARQAMSPPPA